MNESREQILENCLKETVEWLKGLLPAHPNKEYLDDASIEAEIKRVEDALRVK